jgi:hypothetical protein
MSWKANAWIQGCRIGGGNTKAIMYTVANFCTEKAGAIGVEVPEGHSVCWASVEEIADDAECSSRTAKRILADMESHGVIRRTRRHGPYGHRTTDLIWIEWSRPYIVLPAPSAERAKVTDWHLGPEPSTAGPDPVDNGGPEPALGDTTDVPRCHRRYGLGDTAMSPLKEPSPNHSSNRHQPHLENASHDRADARGPPTRLILARCA